VPKAILSNIIVQNVIPPNASLPNVVLSIVILQNVIVQNAILPSDNTSRIPFSQMPLCLKWARVAWLEVEQIF
jgi:hypothetical protein